MTEVKLDEGVRRVKFYDAVDDSLLEFAVIVSRYNNKWVFCKHKERNTYECPGGHREGGENIYDTAKRELWEETGAVSFNLLRICAYSVTRGKRETFGMLYFANITQFEELPCLEIEKVLLFENLPEQWTYPLIQPKLIERVKRELKI